MQFSSSAIFGRWQRLRPIADNSAWLLFDRTVRLGLGLFVNIWIARYLGPERFGLFNYATAFVALFFPLVSLGLDNIVVRELVRAPDHQDETLGTIFMLKLVGATLSILAALGASVFFRPSDGQVHWMVGIIALGAIFQAFDTIDLWFQSQLQSRLTVYAKTSAFLLLTLIRVVLIWRGAPIVAFAYASTAELFVGACGLVIAYHSQRQRLKRWRSSLQKIYDWLYECWPVMLAGIASYAHAKFDQVLLGDLIGNAELGQYSVALRLIETLGFLPVIIQMSAAPAVARAKVRGDEPYYRLLLDLYRLMSLLSIATMVPLGIFAKPVVHLLFGAEYNAASLLLPLMAARILFTNFGVAKGLFFVNEGLFHYFLAVTVTGATLNIALDYTLIPRYASIGAIAAMSFSYLFNTFLLDLFFASTRRNLKIMIQGLLTPWRLRWAMTGEVTQ